MLTINEDNWPVFSRRISSPGAPEDYNEAAVERLMEFLHPWVIDVKNFRPQFRALNKILMIDFETVAEREYYNRAYERYCVEVSKLKAKGEESGTGFAILVEWLKFRQAAEFVRRKWIARNMYNAVAEGYAAGCACNFKATIAGIVLELHERYKVPRSNISLIWGGDTMYSSAPEDLYTDQEIQDILMQSLRGEVIPPSVTRRITKQLTAQNAGLGELPPGLDLGPQDFKKRQIEIDRYQRGDSLYSIFNFKSGGIGLSLHHSDQLTKQKCRKKDNGYAYVEDIPTIPTRPRHSFLAPTYSAIELVQGLGRYPRIASLSDTIQTLVFYKGTIEQAVAATVSRKLKCLSKVVRQREDWTDVIVQSAKGGGGAKQLEYVPDEEEIDGSELNNIDLDDTDDEEQDDS